MISKHDSVAVAQLHIGVTCIEASLEAFALKRLALIQREYVGDEPSAVLYTS